MQSETQTNETKFINRIKNKFDKPNWALDYLKAGLPADLNLDGALTVDIFKKEFLVERPKNQELDQRINALFQDPKHNMLCIESGRGTGKSTFVQTLHMYDPFHTYEYPCIDFSKKKDDIHATMYQYCEDELFRLFRKRYRKICKGSREWFSDYKKNLSLIIQNFPDYSQCSEYYIDALNEAYQCDNISDLDKLFAGHRKRIELIKDLDLKILLLLYLLTCMTEPDSDNKRWILIFDSIEVYVESDARNWIKTIDRVSDFLRAAFDSINKEDEFFSRFTALFPIRTATSMSFASYANLALYQAHGNMWGNGNEYIFPLERFDFASTALLKKLKYLKKIGGDKTPLFQRCLMIVSLLMPKQYVEASLEQSTPSINTEFRLFTKYRLMPLFNYDFRNVIDHLFALLPSPSAAPDTTFLALESIQANAKQSAISSDLAANGENMITARLITNALHDYSPNLFSEIGYVDFNDGHDPGIARAMYNFLYYNELQYYYHNATQENWGGEYRGVLFKTLLEKLRPFSSRWTTSIASILYKASSIIGEGTDYQYVNNAWTNLIVINGLRRHLSFSQFQTLIQNYYLNYPDEKATNDDEMQNLLTCMVRLSDAGRCFTIWLSKQFEFLLARSTSRVSTSPLFVYSYNREKIKESLERPFEIVREIIQHVSIEKLVAGCLQVCSYCHETTPNSRATGCVFINSQANRIRLLDCSLFQRYQECLMLIVDSIDYIDRFRLYVWQVACYERKEQEAQDTNKWLLEEISEFHSLFTSLKNKVETEFQNKKNICAFFYETIAISEELREKLRVKDSDRNTKPEKVIQYHERLRLPRNTLGYHEKDSLFEKAINELKQHPNAKLYDTINSLKESGEEKTNMAGNNANPICASSTLTEESKNSLISSVSEGMNRDLLLWALESPLYKKAVCASDSDYSYLVSALGPSENFRYLGSFSLMKEIWLNHPELGVAPDYEHLADLEFERAFYSKYRDHTTHMFKVFLLGLYLYENSDVIHTAITSIDIDADAFLSIWILSALYHDVGYMIENDGTTEEMYQRMNNVLSEPLTVLFPDDFGTGTEKGILFNHGIQTKRIEGLATIKKELNRFNGKGRKEYLCVNTGNPILKYFDITSQKLEKKSEQDADRIYHDHGIISAGMMMFMQDTLCKYYREFPENDLHPNQKEKLLYLRKTADNYAKYVDHAAYAVALHNIQKDLSPERLGEMARNEVTLGDFRIELNTAPVAFLLRLCDEIQCWDRQYYINPLRAPKPIDGKLLSFHTENGRLQLKISNSKAKEEIINALQDILKPSVTSILPIK